MTERVDNFLRSQHLAADVAVLAFRKTRFRTGRRDGLVDYFGMTERVDDFLRGKDFFASGTPKSFSQTCFSASRFNRRQHVLRMLVVFPSKAVLFSPRLRIGVYSRADDQRVRAAFKRIGHNRGNLCRNRHAFKLRMRSKRLGLDLRERNVLNRSRQHKIRFAAGIADQPYGAGRAGRGGYAVAQRHSLISRERQTAVRKRNGSRAFGRNINPRFDVVECLRADARQVIRQPHLGK